MMTEYYSFMLRLWQADALETPAWRATLENPHTHQLIGFTSLEALCTFLQTMNFSQTAGLADDVPQPQPFPPFSIHKERKHENP
jgi:hypothetical protein